MKDNNLENQLRDKLGGRTIAPSAAAWDRLAHNRQQPKKGKKKFGFYFIAASLAFLLLGSYAFFMNTRPEANMIMPGVVNATAKPDAVVPESTVVPQKVREVVVYALPPTQKITPAADEPAQRIFVQALDVVKNDAGITTAEGIAVAQTIIYRKNISKNDIYEAEANLLLEKSLRDVALQRQVAAPTNDTALLKEVETEMDAYYRSKAMNIFALKHKTIRFAVNKQ